MSNREFDSEDVLRRIFEPTPVKVKDTLEDLFIQRLESLDIPKTRALNIMSMSVRTLDGILSGEQKMIDYIQLIKLANFLSINTEEVVNLYIEKLKEIHEPELENRHTNKKIDFIKENFNLAELKKVGLIKSLTNYNDIIDSLCNYFGLNDILDYKDPEIGIAFSAGIRAKRNSSIKNWMYLAERTSIELRNPYSYDREKLINYFPEIRSHSLDVENGLVNVINHLYQIGITVIFIESFPSSHIRGATFFVNNKPCIAITNYMGFYPTLWFALIHELYHVLFDWKKIIESGYLISQDTDHLLDNSSPHEIKANEFAREYLFSKEKSKKFKPLINDKDSIARIAFSNHVHPSFIYVFDAFDAEKSNRRAWGRARKNNPNIEKLLFKLRHDFKSDISFSDHIRKIRGKIYN